MELTITNSTEKLPWGSAKGHERIAQNITNILNTFKYEVAYNMNLGISADILDKDTETMKGIIIEDLFDNIKANEPRATLKSVNIEEVTADGHIVAVVTVEV